MSRLLSQKILQIHKERTLEIEEEDAKYRLRQFYMLLLVADKARLRLIVQNEKNKKPIE